MTTLGHIPFRVEKWLPKDTLMAIGADGEKPDDWDALTDWQKMSWAIDNHANVFMSEDVYLALKEGIGNDG